MKLKSILFFIIIADIASAQTLPVDGFGHITDSAIAAKLIHDRQYELLADFVAVDGNQSLRWAKFLKAGTQGYIDLNGTEVIKPRYESVGPFNNGVAIFSNRGEMRDRCGSVYNRKYGLLNLQDSVVADDFDALHFIHDHIYAATKDGKSSLIDGNGKTIATVEHHHFRYLNGLLAAAKNGKYALFNASGAQLSDFLYTAIGTVGKFIIANIGAGVYFINAETGQPSDDKFWEFSWNKFSESSDLLAVSVNRDYFLVDRLYKKIGGPYTAINQLSPRYFQVFENGKSALVSDSGKLVLPFDNYIITASENEIIDAGSGDITKFFYVIGSPEYLRDFIHSKFDGAKYGYANASDEWIIPARFDYSHTPEFVNGLSIESVDKKMGVIDSDGKTVIPFKYEFIFRCPDGYIAKKNGKAGIIGNKLKTLVPFKYENISVGSHGNYVAQKNGKFGMIDIRNKVITPFKFESLSPTAKGFALVTDAKGTLFGIVDFSGKLLVPIKYNYIDHDDKYNPEGIFTADLNGNDILVDKYGNERPQR